MVCRDPVKLASGQLKQFRNEKNHDYLPREQDLTLPIITGWGSQNVLLFNALLSILSLSKVS